MKIDGATMIVHCTSACLSTICISTEFSETKYSGFTDGDTGPPAIAYELPAYKDLAALIFQFPSSTHRIRCAVAVVGGCAVSLCIR